MATDREQNVIDKAIAAIELLASVYGKDGELVGGWRAKEFVELHDAVKELRKCELAKSGGRHVRFDWEAIDTRFVERVSDDELLEFVKNSEMCGGYGTIAEVCKRFSRTINSKQQ